MIGNYVTLELHVSYIFLSDTQGYITAVNLSCILHFSLVSSDLA